MTLPKIMLDALEYGDECWIDESDPEKTATWRAIRAHLLSQDAEIERLNRRILESHKATRKAFLAERARLAAADALLREAMEWDWLGEWVEQMAVLDQRIRAHLRGAGDD